MDLPDFRRNTHCFPTHRPNRDVPLAPPYPSRGFEKLSGRVADIHRGQIFDLQGVQPDE